MFRRNSSRKGVVLFLVLATLLIVVVLANIILAIMSTQLRLTHHQVGRIQALYAGKAGMNYAIEMLRTGTWVPGSNCTTVLTSRAGCDLKAVDPTSFPTSIKTIEIYILPYGTAPCTSSPGSTSCVNIVTNYSYTP